MPAIKITLNRLLELFGKSVNSDLPESVRALAARLMTLTAHVIRVDQKIDANVKALSEQIAALTEILQQVAQPEPATASAPAPTTPTVAATDEDETEDDFEARARAEAAAEVAAINADEPTAEVLPLNKKAGGTK